MFCACVGILICLAIIIAGSVISSIDIDVYDFGLYYVLLAIVALTASITLCVIRPAKCCGVSDPKWYTRACESVHQALLAAHEKRLAHLENTTDAGTEVISEESSRRKSTVVGMRQRTTLLMLGPAVQMMHHVIHGVAENTADDEEEEEEEELPSIWWDVTFVDEEEGKVPERKKKKKRKKKRKRPKDPELGTIVTSKADVVVLARPVATEDASSPSRGRSRSPSPTPAKDKTTIRIKLDPPPPDEGAKEIFL